MTSRFSKRGKNPGAVDCWLESLGLYRKNVAYDETCMFRALSEQLLNTQINHEDVRKRCIRYGKQNSKAFRHLVPSKKEWFERLKKLSVHMIVCSEIEVQLACTTYQVDIKIFNAITQDTQEFRGHKLYKGKETLMLCKMGEDHYDAVYTKEHIDSAGFCQSLVYNVLYEKVFEVPEVDSVVHSMLHDKQAAYSVYCPEASTLSVKNDPENEELDDDAEHQQNMLAPFPFKIAKALDPNMYRNIEYDTWLELRREMRLGDWYYGDDKLILGTSCLVTVANEDYQCYIQAISEDDQNCEVYVTKLGQRLTVHYSELRPEDNAKPWPLPYRFARNQAIPVTNGPVSNERKSLRKRREKKMLQSLSEENNVVKAEGMVEEVHVSSYEGCPLDTIDIVPLERLTSAVQVSVPPSPLTPHHDQMEVICDLPERIPWSQSPPNYRPVQVSETIPYPTTPSQLMYPYSPEGTYPPVPLWPPYLLSPDSAISDDVMASPVPYNGNGQKYVYYQADSAYASPTPSSLSFSPFPASFNDRVVCATPTASPVTPHMDMYPVLYPLPTPGTPVYYTHPSPAASLPPVSRPPEFIIPSPSPVPMYNAPPLEVQYLPSPNYVYPSTPPVPWYNAPQVNSQGFVFPSLPNNNSNQNVAHYG